MSAGPEPSGNYRYYGALAYVDFFKLLEECEKEYRHLRGDDQFWATEAHFKRASEARLRRTFSGTKAAGAGGPGGPPL